MDMIYTTITVVSACILKYSDIVDGLGYLCSDFHGSLQFTV